MTNDEKVARAVRIVDITLRESLQGKLNIGEKLSGDELEVSMRNMVKSLAGDEYTITNFKVEGDKASWDLVKEPNNGQ